MDRSKQIKQVEELFNNYKQATVLDDDFTDEIYEFLVSEKLIDLSKEEKIAIYTHAKRIYSTELNSILTCGTFEAINDARERLRELKINDIRPEDKEYMGKICKRLTMIDLFNKLDNINIKP